MPDDMKKRARDLDDNDANRDPISKAPGAHPVGTGLGAAAGGAAGVAGGAAAGAATGTVTGGPAGALIGGAIGAIVGGLAGKAAAEQVNPTVEDAYWRERYQQEPYYNRDYSYDDYAGAYRTGYEGYAQHGSSGKSYNEIEPELQRTYERARATSRLNWEQARPAVRAAWHRFDVSGETTPGRINPTESAAASNMRERETRPRSERRHDS